MIPVHFFLPLSPFLNKAKSLFWLVSAPVFCPILHIVKEKKKQEKRERESRERNTDILYSTTGHCPNKFKTGRKKIAPFSLYRTFVVCVVPFLSKEKNMNLLVLVIPIWVFASSIWVSAYARPVWPDPPLPAASEPLIPTEKQPSSQIPSEMAAHSPGNKQPNFAHSFSFICGFISFVHSFFCEVIAFPPGNARPNCFGIDLFLFSILNLGQQLCVGYSFLFLGKYLGSSFSQYHFEDFFFK